MNLEKMFKMQEALKNRIGYNKSDKMDKLFLALFVELGELANEHRGFKYWSENQQPRTRALRTPTMMEEDKEYYNPVLEEYADGFHFVLEVGLELNYQPKYSCFTYENITKQFNILYQNISTLANTLNHMDYLIVFAAYMGLGEMLGFTQEQIEQAYYEKYAINIQRQESGY